MANSEEITEALLEVSATSDSKEFEEAAYKKYENEVLAAFNSSETSVVEFVKNDVNLLNIALMKSLTKEDLSLAKALLTQDNVDLAYEGKDGLTPLHYLAMCDNIDSEILSLLESNIDSAIKKINDRGLEESKTVTSFSNNTPLHIAVANGNAEMVAFLIDKGLDPLIKNNQGDTALDTAIYNNQPDMVLEILKACKEKGTLSEKIATHHFKNVDIPVFEWALKNGHLEIVKILMESLKIDLTKATSTEYEGLLPLFLACKSFKPEIVEYLLNMGADVNAADQYGKRALHIAVKEGNVKMVRLLIERGAEVNAVDLNRDTALHIAAFYKQFEIAKSLLGIERNPDMHMKNKDKDKALYLATTIGHIELVRLLLDYGAGVDYVDDFGGTALHIAAEDKNIEVMKLLLEKGADISREKTIEFLGSKDYVEIHSLLQERIKISNLVTNLFKDTQSLIELGADKAAEHYLKDVECSDEIKSDLQKDLATHISHIITLRDNKNSDKALAETVNAFTKKLIAGKVPISSMETKVRAKNVVPKSSKTSVSFFSRIKKQILGK